MTLIAGSLGWSGVYIVTDTRVTITSENHNSATYEDDALKCELIKGGIALAVSGSAYVSDIFRNILEEHHLSWYKEALSKKNNGHVFTETPVQVLEELVIKALRETFNSPEVLKMDTRKSGIAGFVAIVDRVPLKLDQEECQYLEKAVEISSSNNSMIEKYKKKILACANGEMDEVEISECMQGCIVTYESNLQSQNIPSRLDTSRVKMGRIAVYGSGVSDNHANDEARTISYMLCETDPQDFSAIAFQLSRTHALSDMQVAPHSEYGFKTFGGGIVSTFLVELPDKPGTVDLLVMEGEVGRKSDGKIVSKVFHDNLGKIHIINEEGNEFTLKNFSEYSKNKVLSTKITF